jgi:tetratricopeptide (TPR) repeat protein
MTASSFSAEQVAGLLGLTPQQIRAYVRGGVVAPERGPRGELRFSFQDLVFLRVVARLAGARISPRRVERAVRGLRARLPGDRPISGVRLDAEGSHLVVREDDRVWSPDSGQYWFAFAPRPVAAPAAPPARIEPVERGAEEPALEVSATAEGWYAFACEIEATQPEEARAAYARALAIDPKLAIAHVNWGCLEHEAGRLADAESHYRAALALESRDVVAGFDLAVVLEDQSRSDEARAAYEHVLDCDATCADAHFNLARLCDRLGDAAAALRHLHAYRRLTQT